MSALLVFSLAICRPSLATVICFMYHCGELYVGSDSLALNGTNESFCKKILPVSETCCAAIGRCYGGYVRDGDAGKLSLIFLPSELEKICQDNYAAKESLVEKTTKIVSGLSAAHRKFL